jgi:hypothetical protein
MGTPPHQHRTSPLAKLEILAAYDARHPMVKRVRCCAEKACIPAISWNAPGPGRGRAGGASQATARYADEGIAHLEREKPRLEQELAKARLVVEVQQNCTRSCGRSPTTSSPSAGRHRDRRRSHRTGPNDWHQASYYRRHRASPTQPRPTLTAHRDRPQPRTLTSQQRTAILDVSHSVND